MPMRRANRTARGRDSGWRTRPRKTKKLIEPATRPASSTSSNIVRSRCDRCSVLRFIIESLIEASAPSTSVARNEEPYSTKRPSPRRYQISPGMNEPSGPRPGGERREADRRQRREAGHGGRVHGALRHERGDRRRATLRQRAIEERPAEPVDDDEHELLARPPVAGGHRRLRSPAYCPWSRRRLR